MPNVDWMPNVELPEVAKPRQKSASRDPRCGKRHPGAVRRTRMALPTRTEPDFSSGRLRLGQNDRPQTHEAPVS